MAKLVWWKRKLLDHSMELFDGNKTQAAKYLNITVRSFRTWCKQAHEDNAAFEHYTSKSTLDKIKTDKDLFFIFPTHEEREDCLNNPYKCSAKPKPVSIKSKYDDTYFEEYTFIE